MDRRRLLKAGSTLGALLAAGAYARYRFLPPGRSRELASVDELARRFCASLDEATRAKVCVDYEHPLRQYHNRGVGGGGLAIDASSFSWEQRGLLTDLLYAGLSERGRERVPEEFFLQLGGVQLMDVLVCGDPSSPPYQLILIRPAPEPAPRRQEPRGRGLRRPAGLRRSARRRTPAPAGQPLSLPARARRAPVRASRASQRAEALLATAPEQTQIELQGRAGRFPGTPLASATARAAPLAQELVDGILSTVSAGRRRLRRRVPGARTAGVEALFASYYADGEVGGSGSYQIFRLEGPAAVLPLPRRAARARLRERRHGRRRAAQRGRAARREPGGARARGREGALRARAGGRSTRTELATTTRDAVVGRLRKGAIPRGRRLRARELAGRVRGGRGGGRAARAGAGRGGWTASGTRIDPAHRYTIATTTEFGPEHLGRIESSRAESSCAMVVIADLRERGFAGLHG
jgi:hypothetical protein